MDKYTVCLLFIVCTASFCSSTEEDAKSEDAVIDETKLEYAKGSMCGYCEYCVVGIYIIAQLCMYIFELPLYFSILINIRDL